MIMKLLDLLSIFFAVTINLEVLPDTITALSQFLNRAAITWKDGKGGTGKGSNFALYTTVCAFAAGSVSYFCTSRSSDIWGEGGGVYPVGGGSRGHKQHLG